MQNLMLLWFGPIPYPFDSPYSNEVIRFWTTFITWQNLIIIVVSTLTIALLYAFMKFTFLGKALRAVAQDRETAGLMGINPNQLIMLTFVIASALAGLGGAMLGPVLVLTPFAGTTVIVKAFAIVIIGGFGNVDLVGHDHDGRLRHVVEGNFQSNERHAKKDDRKCDISDPIYAMAPRCGAGNARLNAMDALQK